MHPPDDTEEPTGALPGQPDPLTAPTPSGPPAPPAPAVPASMRTEMWPIGTVRRYWRNPRRKQNVQKIGASLRKFGWRQPIVVDKDGTIIVGDTRYLGAQANGDTHVPVWQAVDLSEAEAHAYRIADNRIAEESEWDDAALRAELELLQSLGIEDLDAMEEATGFDEDELARYLGDGADNAHHLEPVAVQQFPATTWVLVGVPTLRYHEIAEHVEAITNTPDVFCEVTANDDRP